MPAFYVNAGRMPAPPEQNKKPHRSLSPLMGRGCPAGAGEGLNKKRKPLFSFVFMPQARRPWLLVFCPCFAPAVCASRVLGASCTSVLRTHALGSNPRPPAQNKKPADAGFWRGVRDLPFVARPSWPHQPEQPRLFSAHPAPRSFGLTRSVQIRARPPKTKNPLTRVFGGAYGI